jgi:hypothetical protein
MLSMHAIIIRESKHVVRYASRNFQLILSTYIFYVNSSNYNKIRTFPLNNRHINIGKQLAMM